MRVIHCEQCGTPLPWTAQYCAVCGMPVSLHPLISDYPDASSQHTKRPRTGSLKTYSFYAMGPDDPDETQPLSNPRVKTVPDDPDETQRLDHSQVRTASASMPVTPSVDNAAALAFLESWPEDEEMDEETLQWRRDTWQKFVTRKTPAIPVGTVSAVATAVSTAPVTPATPAASPLPYRAGDNGSAPPLLPSPFHKQNKRPPRSLLMPRLAGWVAIAVIVALLLGGGFGIFVSLGHAPTTKPSTGPLTLQATPSSIAFGGILTLHGSHFTPHALVGLSRDTNIPVFDTSGSSRITADASGSFSDTVSIDGSWTPGTHTINAEDAHLHKTARFTVTITGQSISLRPAHLELSATSIDLGSGDQATDSAQTIVLSNAGGDEINWQSAVSQPWLLLSPPDGTIAPGQQMQVTLAADRSTLKVGSYSASVVFTSNTGSVTLPVRLLVTPLQPGHAPVIQVIPAALSFSGSDGGASPAPQSVTISNPGVLPLQWNATSSTTDGTNWLNTSQQSGTVAKGGAQSISVSVNSSQLLPGVYYGSITFASQGSPVAVNSPQTIYVSVTIAPQCAIQVSPGALSFTGVYLQPSPSAKTISIGTSQSCSAPLNWSVSAFTVTGGRWLTVSASSGRTPSGPAVGVNATGLKPGTYSGSLVFSSAGGTQTMPVTLLIGQATTPIISAAPALLNVNGVVGQTAPTVQSIVLSNIGGGTLSWSAAAATTVGGAWLTVTPAAGLLAAQKSTTLSVTVSVLKTLTPGTYTGSVTITGKDSTGLIAVGSPQTLPVTFIVQAPCSVATSLPALTFQSVVGQPAPVPQQITISAAGACINALNWSAALATVPAGGTWLTATPAAGTVSPTVPSLATVGIVNTGLIAGTYSGSITVTAIDSVTHLQVGLPQVVTVTLTVLPVCTLQPPSVTSETFSSSVGANPAAQTFTIGVAGACTGSVTITPTATMSSGTGWLAVSPASAPVVANSTATFTVTVTSAALAAGSYAGSISLAAVNSAGVAIAGSPQVVGITLTVAAPPALSVAPASLTFNITPGPATQNITITNSGGSPLNWSAALASGAPTYVTIASPASGTLAAGASATLTISVNATGVAPGTTVSTSVTISAVNAATGGAVTGSPATVPISITIAAPPPAMQLNTTALSFTTTAGTNPAPQTITITNTGGGTLNWTAGTPSQPWLTVTPASGSDAAGGTSTPSFNVNVAGMTAGSYSATVSITAPGGISQTVTVTLTIS
jgi:hypothetical protein